MSLEGEIKEYTHKRLEKEISIAKKYLEDLHDCSDNIATRPMRFKVFIRNAWGSYPNTHNAESKGKDLLKTLKRTVKKFKELNRRSDVQGSIHISVILSDGVSFGVPEELHYDTTQKMKEYVPPDSKEASE